MTYWIALFTVPLLLAFATGACAAQYLKRDDRDRMGAVFWGGLALSYVVMAVGFLLGPVSAVAVIPGAAAAFCGWVAIQFWRRRKDRKPSRVLGVVKNLGHRLTVVPATSPP